MRACVSKAPVNLDQSTHVQFKLADFSASLLWVETINCRHGSGQIRDNNLNSLLAGCWTDSL